LSLRHKIEQEIRNHGPISFSRYMELCLYDPVEGYYSRSSNQFGKAGDFFTSSDVHAVFGRLLARQFEEMWRALDRPPRLELLELGPGRGLFARDVLDWSQKKFPDFFAALTYTLQESSPALRAKLSENLDSHISGGKAILPVVSQGSSVARQMAATQMHDELHRLRICRSLPIETPIIVFANEFFDALPVEILSSQGKLHLAIHGDRLSEVWLPSMADELAFLDRYSVHPEVNERIEVPLAAQDWITDVAANIHRGFLLTIDYGYTRSDQLAGRHRGTLMAYRQHSTSSNPYEAPGEQDLTAHVNFTALSALLQQAGMTTQRLITQSQFLMGIGECNQFADAFEECRLSQERAKVALQLKHLISPEGLGETFQVLIASKQVEEGKVTSLSGLRFGR
jgi:SAM-dependent MidA family methyltransferase